MKKYYLGIVSILAHNFFNPIWSLQFLSGIFWQHMLILQTSTLCKPCQLILTRENELWIMVNIKLSVLNQMTWLSLKWYRVTEKSSQTIIISNFYLIYKHKTAIYLILSYFFRKVFTFESSCVAEESSILCRLAYRIIWLINYIRSSKVEKVKTINSSSENIDNKLFRVATFLYVLKGICHTAGSLPYAVAVALVQEYCS